MKPAIIIGMMAIIFLIGLNYTGATLINGLVGYYSMDEAVANITDSSGHNLNSTAATMDVISGKIGNGRSSSLATNLIILSPNISNYFPASNINLTINFWIKNQAYLDPYSGYWHCNNAGGNYMDMHINDPIGSKLNFLQESGSYTTVTAPYSSLTDWVMITATINSGTNMSIYYNGTLMGNTSGTQFVTNQYFTNCRIGVGNADNRGMGGIYDEFGIWNRSLNSTEILQLYNNGVGLPYPFGLVDPSYNVNCTSCNPPIGSTSRPYETDDTTPTFKFNIFWPMACRISDMNINYTAMGNSRDCDNGTTNSTHTCTLTTQDALVDYNTSVYISCNYNEANNATISFPMLISSLETPNSSEAIMQGIENSVIGSGATIYTNQKVYLRALNGANVTATVTKVVAYGNQRWLFNYVNATGNLSGIFNLTPVVYSLDMKNMSIKAIRGNVTALINSTKI